MPLAIVLTIILALISPCALHSSDWPRFRGPNGSGVSESTGLPTEIGPNKNVVWKIPLPEGHSSPIVSGNRIFLTMAEGGTLVDAGRKKFVDQGGKLYTVSLDPGNGEILWKKEAPRPRMERYQHTNTPASPSPAVDGENVYVFFGDFGLISYRYDGTERWRLPLGPFNNVNGHGSSPIVAGDKVILVCDSDTDAYLLAVHKDTGKVAWKTERPETTRSYVTPALYSPPEGGSQIIVPSAYFLGSYSAETGEKLWWASGGGWQPKSTPVVANGMIYSNSWEGGGPTPGQIIPTYAELLEKGDANGDGKLAEAEFKIARPKMSFENTDLDENKFIDTRDWQFYTYRKNSPSSLMAVRPSGRGDITKSGSVAWTLEKFLPNAPSPLVYKGVLYLVKDGGILTSLNPETGEVLKQGRLTGALDKYYSSPVGADGKIYMFDQLGKGTVVKAGAQWEVLSSSDFGEEVFATPAIVDNRIYIRTSGNLYCFEQASDALGKP